MIPSWKKLIHGEIMPQDLPKSRKAKQCACGTWFSVARSHYERHKSCSVSCLNAARKLVKDKRIASCSYCGKDFIPRPAQIRDGEGKSCSISCAMKTVSKTESFYEARVKSGLTYKNSLASGKFQRLSGENHPQWSGGSKAAQARRQASGKALLYGKTYRKMNKERVREWTQRRKSIKADTGRLPKGTVKRIYELQRGKCANCNISLLGNYHVDHIMPLSLGGKHEPLNIQILCPKCNVRKWAYHPIKFAQKQGRLL